MTYLPPQEVEQATGFMSVLSDPNKYQSLMDKMIQMDKDLDVKKQSLSKSYDEFRAKVADVEQREKAQLEVAALNADLQKSLDEQKKKLESDKVSLDLSISSANTSQYEKSKELEILSHTLRDREANVLNRETAVQKLEQDQKVLFAKASALKDELESKISKLKEII